VKYDKDQGLLLCEEAEEGGSGQKKDSKGDEKGGGGRKGGYKEGGRGQGGKEMQGPRWGNLQHRGEPRRKNETCRYPFRDEKLNRKKVSQRKKIAGSERGSVKGMEKRWEKSKFL